MKYKKISYLFEFGITIEILKRAARLAKKYISKEANQRILKWRDKLVLKKLRSIVEHALNGWDDGTIEEPSVNIWTMWWQGEEQMPELVKACTNSIRKNIHGQFVIVTCDNYADYVSLKPWIIEKFQKGYISITHFSDIVRFNLLNKYGGLWIDSTVLVTEKFVLPFNDRFWTWREDLPFNDCISKGRWSVFLMYMPKGYCYARFMCRCIDEYWKKHKQIIDYFWLDYFTEEALKQIPSVYEDWKLLPIYKDIFQLSGKMNLEFCARNEDLYLNNLPLHKTQRRSQFEHFTKEGNQTIYSHILEEYK